MLDHSKCDARGCCLILPGEEIHCAIIDNGIKPKIRKRLEAEPFEVIVAG